MSGEGVMLISRAALVILGAPNLVGVHINHLRWGTSHARGDDVGWREMNEALQAFHDANEAFDRAIASMRETLTAVHDANHAQGDAINGVIAANRAALTLLNDETHD
jgi:hypothetical protein